LGYERTVSIRKRTMLIYVGVPLGRQGTQRKATSEVFVVEMEETALALEGKTATNDCGSEAAADGVRAVVEAP
jgi:hypothetical protein